MELVVEDFGGFYKIILPQRFSVDEAENFRKETYRLMENSKKFCIIDFSKCEFIDSTGLGVLVSVYKKCVESNGSLKLCSINSIQVRKIFQLTRLDKVFSIYNTFEEAKNS